MTQPDPEVQAELTTRINTVAQAAADRADAIIRQHFRNTPASEDKLAGLAASYDPVTVADRSAEEAIRETIRDAFPEHAITGEEYAFTEGTQPYEWIIDPIDGTRSFLAGLPTFGTLIGVCERIADRRRPLYGLMSQPFTRERYASGENAVHYTGPDGNRRLRSRRCGALADAVLATTTPDIFEEGHERTVFETVRTSARFTRYGTDCYAYVQLAAGNIDVIVESGLKIYDIAALIPIIEAAGGKITDWTGAPVGDGGQILAVGDPALAAEVLPMLAGQ